MTAGTGPGAITADGCPVQVYLRFPPLGEARLVHETAGPDASVLDLGCGTGRIAHPLVELGHPVTAVDFSADMLAHVHGAETVLSPIAGLDLGRTFDVVLMAGHLVNTVDDTQRRALLATAAGHVADDGMLIAEVYPPGWFDNAGARPAGHIGDVAADMYDIRRRGDVLSATIRYRIGDSEWTQTFDALRLDTEALRRELRDAGLSFVRWLRADESWFAARRAVPTGS
jgi:SAM-dependent methyltransferase